MIIKIKYNKAENTLEVTNDIPECAVIVNPNTLIDNDNELKFEMAVNTSYLAEIQTTDGEPNE